MKTKSFKELYKGQTIFAIWEVDEQDKKVGQYPILSFGLKKAKVMNDHIQDLKNFIADPDYLHDLVPILDEEIGEL